MPSFFLAILIAIFVIPTAWFVFLGVSYAALKKPAMTLAVMFLSFGCLYTGGLIYMGY